MKSIGLSTHAAIVDKKVFYYYFYDKETGSNSEPKETTITSEVYEIGGQWTCMVEGVSGVVALTHLSENYYPEEYIKVTSGQSRYMHYLNVGDCYYNFSHFLGITPPKLEQNNEGLFRYVSRKYEGVAGDYSKTLKDAKASYKEVLKTVKKNGEYIHTY